MGSSSYDPDWGLSAMGMPGKSAFIRLNAKRGGWVAAPSRDQGLPACSAGESRRRELLGAALEREPHRLWPRAGTGLEGDVHHEAVDADLQLGRVDTELDRGRVLRVLDLLDDLAVEDERDGRDLRALDAGVEGLADAAGRAEQLGRTRHDPLRQQQLLGLGQ